MPKTVIVKDLLTTDLDPVLTTNLFKPAAVLLVVWGDPPHIMMTEKPQHMRVHAGEISFPGGKPEGIDSDLCDTAMRETLEETGLQIDRKDVIGQLEPVSTLNSGYLILPFVSVIRDASSVVPNEEVKEILHIPLIPLLKTMAPDVMHGPHKDMYEFRHRGRQIWGASARILMQLHDILV